MRLGSLAIALSLLLGSSGVLATSVTDAEPASAATAQEPYRVLDTRTGSKPGSEAVLTVATGHPGATAVGVNITITENDLPGFVTAWSGSGSRPTASVLNTDAPDQTRANYVVVPVQADGTFRLYTQRSAHLVVDVMGGFDGSCASALPSPARVLDTRSGATPAGGSVLTVSTGRAGASAVGVNLTITENQLPGFLTAWSGAGARPTASVLNTDAPGQTRANYLVVPVAADGTFSLFTQQPAHVVVDVMGTFAGSCASTLASPTRVLDTRSGPAPAGGSVLTVSTGRAGSAAIGVNVTFTETSAPGFATAWSGDGSMPIASVLNADAAGETIANYAVVPLRADGTFRIFLQRSTHVVVDVMGTVTYNHVGTVPTCPAGQVGMVPDCLPVPPAPLQAGKSWRVNFHDEFDGTALNTSNWTPCFDWNTGGCTSSFNSGKEHYDPGQVRISNGTAKLVAEPLSPPRADGACLNGSCTYKAGLISTARPNASNGSAYLRPFTYGYVEARVKYPAISGIFTAFWMLPTNPSFSYRSEIDIVEILGGDPDTIFQTYHYNNRSSSFAVNRGDHNNGACAVKDYSKDWVRFGVDWEPTYIAWYIDGVKCGQFNGNTSTIENGPMQIILHTMVDNQWERDWGLVLPNQNVVATLEVDYVRVYQQQ